MIIITVVIDEKEAGKLHINQNGEDEDGATGLECEFAISVRDAVNAAIYANAVKQSEHADVDIIHKEQPLRMENLPDPRN